VLYRSAILLPIVLSSSSELPNKPDRTARLLLLRLYYSSVPLLLLFHSITLFSYTIFSLSLSHSFNLVCVLYTPSSAHNVFRNPLFYFFVLYILLRSLHFSPHLPYSSTVFLPFTFIPNPLVTTKSRFYSLPLHQVLFIFYHLTFSSDPRSFLRALLTPLFEAKRRLRSDIPTTRSLHQNIITVPGSRICTVGSRKMSGKAKDLNTEYVR
jgi:hypothetical protein